MKNYTANIQSTLNLAVRYHQAGKLEEAIALYQRAIAINPNIGEAHYNLGIILWKQGRPGEAISSFQSAIAADPNDAYSYYNLANMLQGQGRMDEAIALYQRVVAINPNYAEAHNNLGNLLQEQGRLDEAISSYRSAIAANPDDVYSHYNLGNVLQEQGRADEAIVSYKNAIAINPGYMEAYNSLGYMLQQQGKIDKAIDAYQKALEKDPDNPVAEHMLASLTGKTTKSAPPEYVKSLFDYFSRNFEDQLVEKLDYHSPRLLRRMLDRILKGDYCFQNAIDLGCGTGLSGMEFREITKSLSGIDISPKMIEKAKEKNIYDYLEAVDIIDFFVNTREKYDLFIATDVLVYIGNLKPLFSLVESHASKGAYFLFLTESTDEKEYLLRPTGRYAHSLSYILSLAEECHFEVAVCEPAIIRKHHESGIMGDHLILRYLR